MLQCNIICPTRQTPVEIMMEVIRLIWFNGSKLKNLPLLLIYSLPRPVWHDFIARCLLSFGGHIHIVHPDAALDGAIEIKGKKQLRLVLEYFNSITRWWLQLQSEFQNMFVVNVKPLSVESYASSMNKKDARHPLEHVICFVFIVN